MIRVFIAGQEWSIYVPKINGDKTIIIFGSLWRSVVVLPTCKLFGHADLCGLFFPHPVDSLRPGKMPPAFQQMCLCPLSSFITFHITYRLYFTRRCTCAVAQMPSDPDYCVSCKTHCACFVQFDRRVSTKPGGPAQQKACLGGVTIQWQKVELNCSLAHIKSACKVESWTNTVYWIICILLLFTLSNVTASENDFLKKLLCGTRLFCGFQNLCSAFSKIL